MVDRVETTQVLVLGAGPGGYAAAFRAADLGLDVALVDPQSEPGGVCLHRGCIPSKAFLHVARLLREARDASQWGIDYPPPRIDIERLRDWKNEVVGRLTGGLRSLCKARGVRLLQGRATFRDAGSVYIDGTGPDQGELCFDHAIIATGSRPVPPSELLLESDRVMTSTGALELESIPKRLLVIGGGYIGLELGAFYSTLGSQVTVVEMTDSLLGDVDRDLLRVLARSLTEHLEEIMLSTKVVSLTEEAAGLRVIVESKEGGRREELFDRALLAVGRRPNSSGLGLDTTAVEIDERGFIRVDEQRRTHEPSIFAIGDVAGPPLLAHKATHEGLVAAEVAAGAKVAFEPQAVPAVVFTDPELAWCGLTETEARAQRREVRVARFPWQASGRAATLGRSDGLTKLLVDPKSEAVLGVGVVGAGAGELIAEAALAIEMGATVGDLAATVHPHPTLSETLMEAAEAFYGRSVHLGPRR